MGLLKIHKKGEKKNNISQVEQEITKLDIDKLGISNQAVVKIKSLAEYKNNKFFRVGLSGGGCSGLTINFSFCNNKQERDKVFVKDSVNIIIDSKSLGILGGATLHFREYLGSGEFILVNNPAAKQCSCGKSFSL